jgi:hypothetical protein
MNLQSGPKLKMPSWTYNITVNHCGRILSTTHGHPAHWNDKTIVLFYAFVHGIYEGKMLDDNKFTLFELDEKGDVIKVQYQGAWFLVDNGYLNWPTTVPKLNCTFHYKEIRFSQWLELVRKDVKCTFGIMKGRFQILKAAIRIHGVKATDEVWLTCCALHNYLLEVDCLDKDWIHGVASEWEGGLGNHHSADVAEHGPNFAIGWLNLPKDMRTFNMLGMGPGTNDEESNSDKAEEHVGENPATGDHRLVRIVCKLILPYFRDRLVKHFDILFHQNKIKWPTRMGATAPPS